MKVEFEFLYKNGKEEQFVLEGSKEEIDNVLYQIEICFKDAKPGFLAFGNSENGSYIRTDDVSRVSIKSIDNE